MDSQKILSKIREVSTPDVYAQAENILEKAQELRKRASEKRDLMDNYTERYNALVDHANAMTSGLASSLKIIVDVSSVLSAYRALLDEVSRALDVATQSVPTANIYELKKLTRDIMADLHKNFDENYQRIASFIESSGSRRGEYLENLGRVRDSLKRLERQGSELGGAVAADWIDSFQKK